MRRLADVPLRAITPSQAGSQARRLMARDDDIVMGGAGVPDAQPMEKPTKEQSLRAESQIVPTVGRKAFINDVIVRLAAQTRPPDELIVSAPDPSHVERIEHPAFLISYVFGREGLTAQRNQALVHALDRCDIVTFFDDDFLPARDYLETVERLLDRHPDWTVVSGHVVLDGANNAGYSVADGLAALARGEADAASRVVWVDERRGAYGCNMSMRTRDVGEHRFDERLPLYGWQEDTDFTRRVARNGMVVRTNELIGVRLGHKGGRISGLRLGYSQIANPIYLLRKGTMPLPAACALMGRNFVANVVKSLRPEPYVDRRGRLRGNLRALYHLLQGRLAPEEILKL